MVQFWSVKCIGLARISKNFEQLFISIQAITVCGCKFQKLLNLFSTLAVFLFGLY